MTQTIALINEGEVEFNNEFLTIRDRKQKLTMRMIHVSTFIWTFYSATIVYKQRADPDTTVLLFWVAIFIINLLGALYLFRTTWTERIWLDDVRSATIKNRWNSVIITLKLKSGRLRKIHAPRNGAAELKSFVSTNFPA